ncbi:MAG: alpha-L-fucosidase 2 [Rhodothermales bacterium]|jgi:alpha-L-fucosidase 2
MTRLLTHCIACAALLVVFGAVVPSKAQAQTQDWAQYRLIYDEPAAAWNEALPVGNGRLGAMIYGIPGQERLALNEETLWTGGPYDPTVEGGAEALPEIQRLLFAGDVEKAHDLFGRTMMGVPYEQQKYQPFGTLWLDFPGHEAATDYTRELDMDAGLVHVRYSVDGTIFTRTTFSSEPSQVLVMRLEASESGALNFDGMMQGVRNPAHSNYGTDYFRMDGLGPDTLRVTGKNSDYLGVTGALTYEGRLVARAEGGTVEVDYRTLKVRGANAVTLVFAAATSFVDYNDTSADPAARVAEVLEAVASKPYATLKEEHVQDHRRLFRRVSLGAGPVSSIPRMTDDRLAALDSIPDPALFALTYQWGRYLLMASSRPGTQAANLQGIWNEDPNPSWDSKYTVNINLPMNYWPAETASLPELAEPLYQLVNDVSETGVSVAREHWGAGGWVLHQNTDLWRAAAPMDGPSWGAWPVGGAWLVTHMIERDRFDSDPAFLERWYPVVRDQALFLSDILVEHPDNGWLVTAPSNSPENFPAYPGNGRYFDETSGLFLNGRMMQPGPTMDIHIVRAVFAGFLDWSNRMDADPVLRAEIAAQMDRLPPNQIGRQGRLQEWIEDWEDIEPEHRHLSHLWGVYPGEEISPDATPAMAEAASVSMDLRGTGGCGWSYAHKVGARARLHQGAEGEEQLVRYLADNVLPNLFSRCGRTLQVDGSFGMTAAIGEMLLQSDRGVLEILPALPPTWSEGAVSGLRARGGFTVGLEWEGGSATRVELVSREGSPVELSGIDAREVWSDGNRVRFRRLESGSIAFDTEPGARYDVTLRN